MGMELFNSYDFRLLRTAVSAKLTPCAQDRPTNPSTNSFVVSAACKPRSMMPETAHMLENQHRSAVGTGFWRGRTGLKCVLTTFLNVVMFVETTGG